VTSVTSCARWLSLISSMRRCSRLSSESCGRAASAIWRSICRTNCSMRVAAASAFSCCRLASATLFSWYEKYSPTPPEISSAPQTSARMNRK